MVMAKEQLAADIKVGDRLPDGAKVINVRYIKQGAIGIEYDDPERIERGRNALADYAEAYRLDQMQPRTDVLNPRDWYEPVFDSSK